MKTVNSKNKAVLLLSSAILALLITNCAKKKDAAAMKVEEDALVQTSSFYPGELAASVKSAQLELQNAESETIYELRGRSVRAAVDGGFISGPQTKPGQKDEGVIANPNAPQVSPSAVPSPAPIVSQAQVPEPVTPVAVVPAPSTEAVPGAPAAENTDVTAPVSPIVENSNPEVLPSTKDQGAIGQVPSTGQTDVGVIAGQGSSSTQAGPVPETPSAGSVQPESSIANSDTPTVNESPNTAGINPEADTNNTDPSNSAATHPTTNGAGQNDGGAIANEGSGVGIDQGSVVQNPPAATNTVTPAIPSAENSNVATGNTPSEIVANGNTSNENTSNPNTAGENTTADNSLPSTGLPDSGVVPSSGETTSPDSGDRDVASGPMPPSAPEVTTGTDGISTSPETKAEDAVPTEQSVVDKAKEIVDDIKKWIDEKIAEITKPTVPDETTNPSPSVSSGPNSGTHATHPTAENPPVVHEGAVVVNPNPTGVPIASQSPTPTPSVSPVVPKPEVIVENEPGAIEKDPSVDVAISKVCSVNRSRIPYPQFMFLEEAKYPIVSIEAQVPKEKVQKKKHHNMWAAMGFGSSGYSQGGQCGCKTSRPTKFEAAASESLSTFNFYEQRFRQAFDVKVTDMKKRFPKEWSQILFSVRVCDDRNGNGMCSDEAPERMLSVSTVGFTLDHIPSVLPVDVWFGRYMTRANDPDICEKQYSPLVLDLDGNGIALSGPDTNNVEFDLNDTGQTIRTGWVAGNDDAFLVLDMNDNGIIDSGAELFGSATKMPSGARAKNGFEALSQYDSNHDGVMNERDQMWTSLRVWVDYNHNARTEKGEIFSLNRVGIQSIKLDYTPMNEIDPFGNQTKERSTFRMAGFGSGYSVARLIVDIWFNTLVRQQ